MSRAPSNRRRAAAREQRSHDRRIRIIRHLAARSGFVALAPWQERFLEDRMTATEVVGMSPIAHAIRYPQTPGPTTAPGKPERHTST